MGHFKVYVVGQVLRGYNLNFFQVVVVATYRRETSYVGLTLFAQLDLGTLVVGCRGVAVVTVPTSQGQLVVARFTVGGVVYTSVNYFHQTMGVYGGDIFKRVVCPVVGLLNKRGLTYGGRFVGVLELLGVGGLRV